MSFGIEAIKLISEYGIDELGLKIIYADALHRNKRSQYVLEKWGFIYIDTDEKFIYYKFSK